MIFNDHSNLAGSHAFLSASNYHWINYSNEKLIDVYRNSQAAKKGSELHEFANRAVKLGIKLTRTEKSLNMYVNDAIGYRMETEQILYYSSNAYGTCDAILFKKNFLRIHDFKSGVTPSSMHQLEVYAALFCLEYRMRPGDIAMELRIYQHDMIEIYVPEVDTIAHIMDTIIRFDKQIELLKGEG